MNMKKMLFIILALSPLALLANDQDVQTDIIQRTVNFVIFVAIIYYLLADKLKTFFSDRTKSIQAELDKVQSTLEESKKKVQDAKDELENSKKIANELVNDANADINSIKSKISEAFDNEISNLTAAFDGKLEIETKKMKKQIVAEILEELLSDDNISIKQNDLVNIILKKVA
jgi:F-type H+-transporting ATPase subunit b